MRSEWKKRLPALALAGVMALGLPACGAKDTQEEQASAAMTESEYQQAVSALGEDMQEILRFTAGMGETDADAEESKQSLEALKEPLEAFIEMEPPAKYAEGHEKVCEGCRAMLDYADILSAAIGVTDEEVLEQVDSKLQTARGQAVAALEEATELLQQADESE